MANKKYYLGLDVGTDSVGWCLTDQNYNIIKKQGKSLWGVRMFDGAQTAEERRNYRGQRRRIDRQRERLDLLQSLFSEEINKVDPTFIERLNESAYHIEDRSNRDSQYTLFIKKGFTDKEYYKEYPTIFHLRKHLLESDKKEDIRLVYLACHNMLKHRGNFLESNFDPSNPFNEDEAESLFESLYEVVKSHDETATFNYHGNINKMLNAFVNNKSITTRNESLNEILCSNIKGEKNIAYSVYIPLIAGKSKTFKDLVKASSMEDDEVDDDLLKIKLTLDDDDFDTHMETLFDKYSSELEPELNAILDCRSLRNMFTLAMVLGPNNPYISVAMVNQYNENQKDLKNLKNFVKSNYLPEIYNKIFRRTDVEGNYVSYIGYTSWAGKTLPAEKKCKKEDFYGFLKKELSLDKKDTMDDFKEDILNKIDAGTYLLKQRNSTNGKYPYQLNELEMKKILDNQKKFYPFLNLTDGNKDYPTLADKIVSILTFRIPYSVGPLYTNDIENDERKKYSWIIKKNNEKVLPWTFNEVVDIDKTSEEFIRRMQNKCTYLKGENDYCLPKESIIFCYYNVLNFLNKKNINYEPISHNDKLGIIRDLYLNDKNVTIKKIKDWYKKNYDPSHEVEITTSNEKELDVADVNASMNSYVTLKNIFGYTDKQMKDKIVDLEKLIKDITIFEDKDILEKKLKNNRADYPTLELSDEIIKKLKGLSYSGWSRFSLNLLAGIKDSEGYTIIGRMVDTNDSFMEVLWRNDGKFNSLISKYNDSVGYNPSSMTIEEYIDEVAASPVVKRSLNQSFLIIQELEKIVDHEIDKYFIEFTRYEGEKKRTVSRKDKMLDLYKYIKDNQFADIKGQLEEEPDLRSDRLFLYFQQMGKCMYSGDTIDLDRLSEDYEIDHIVPWSIENNDSFDNKVLVKKECNQEKTNIYPLDRNLLWDDKGGYKAAEAYWKYLKDNKLISSEKYARLTRRQELSDEKDYKEFINRQLTSTNQTTRSLANLLRDYLHVSNENIVFSKASTISYYRNKFGIYKSRTANNFHHAHDAYLNIILGNVTDQYFKNKNVRDLYDQDHLLTTNIEKVLEKDNVVSVEGVVIYSRDRFYQMIEKQIFHCFDILTTTRAYEDHSMLSKVTIKPKGKAKFPIKSSEPYNKLDNYGGYTDPKYSFYTLIKTRVKGKDVARLIPIPAFYRNDIHGYIKSVLDYDNFDIVVDKVKINSVVKMNKTKFCITGVSGSMFLIKNAKERIFSKVDIKTIHDIDKFLELLKKQRITISEKLFDSSEKNYSEICARIYNQFKYHVNSEDAELILSRSGDKEKPDTKLTKEQLCGMYDTVIHLFGKKDKNGVLEYEYSNIIGLTQKLIEQEELFKSLDLLKQIYVVSELLVLLKCNQRADADLRFLGLSEHSGVISTNQSLGDHFQLIAESPTGFYQKVLYEQ